MTQMWGPGLAAEVEYRLDKLTHVAQAARRPRRRVRRTPVAAAGPVADVTTASNVPVSEPALAEPSGSRAA